MNNKKKNFLEKYIGILTEFFIKFFLSLVISIGVPIICFLLFIAIQPREVIKIDNYLKQQLKQFTNISIDYSHSIITSYRLKTLRFIINDIQISNKDFNIKIPLVMVDIELLNIFRKRDIINNIYINNLMVKITRDNKDTLLIAEQQNSNLLNLKIIGDLIDKYKNYLIIKTITFDRANIFENDKHINIKHLLITSKSQNNKITADFDLIGKLSKSNFDINIKNSCSYMLSNRNLNCNLNILNLSFTDINNLIFRRFDTIYKHSDKIFSTFTLKLFIDITNFEKINNIQYFLLSDSGNFEIKELFNSKVFFKNFNLSGGLKANGKNITINKSSIDLFTEHNSNKINHFDFYVSTEKNNNVLLTIKSNKIYLQDLETLWPKILNSKTDIRQWIIDAVNGGTVENIDTKLTFSPSNESDYMLTRVDAIFDLNGNNLNYDKSFPAIKDIIGKARFTKNDMKIIIDTAKSESSIIKNGEIFLDFDILNLSIKANILGQTHDLGHYINYSNKQEIEKNLDNYVKGTATTEVDITLPLSDIKNMFFKSKIFVNSSFNIEDNFIFSNNSKAILNMKKYSDTNTFKTTVNLKEAIIDYSMYDFIKQYNQATTLYLDVVIDDKLVLLDDIKIIDGNVLSLQGRGIIANGILQSLNINNIKHKDMNLNVFVKAQDNNFIVNILTNKFVLNLNNNGNSKDNDATFTFDNLTNNGLILTAIADDFFINNFKLTNLNLYSLYYNKRLKKADIIVFDNHKNKLEYTVENDDKNNNQFNIKIDNFGDFLNNLPITDKIKGGNLEVKGNYKNKLVDISLLIKDDFDIFYDRKNDKLITTLVENEMVSKSIKKKLNRTVFQYKTLKAELNYNFNSRNLHIKRYLFDSKNFFTGLNFSGTGNINLSTGKTNLSGAIIPLSSVNSMFGINKIPLLNKVLFNDKDGGLFVVGFEITKQNYQQDYKIKITKYDTFVNSTKSLLFLLFLL